MTDFSTLSLNDRIKTAVNEQMKAGVEKRKAQALAALSIIETAALWTVPRSADLWYDLDCWPTRVLVGLELGEPIYQRGGDGAIIRDGNGNPVTDVTLIRQTATDDPEAVQFLSSKGWIAPLDPSKAKFVKNQAPPYYIVRGQFAGVGTSAMALFFEWVMDKRKGRILNNFSIGPTQMWMAYSGEGARAGLVKQMDAAWPDTWDDIWRFYKTADAGSLGNKIIYLDPKRTGMNFYPPDDPKNRDRIIKWLSYHVGNVAGATSYYDNHYAAALAKTLSLT